MFKKLKDKIAEEVKSSPQRLQQLTQTVTEKIQNATSDESFFSIGEDDSSTPEPGFSNVSLSNPSTPQSGHVRKNSNSSIASDISFLPRYESATNLYHLQSDLDISASEIDDNVSTSSQLGHLSKEQIHAAFQKAQMRYHKYRGRYTDIKNYYKELEKENGKIKQVLVETQDKALRRVAELREQCSLEQKAKAHLENALRLEIDEKQYVIDTLKTKVNLLRDKNCNTEKSEALLNLDDGKETLTNDLKTAQNEIEVLNARLQEMKANAIVFSSKEGDLKKKIADLEEMAKKKALEMDEVVERERENNLIIAQTKMELHTEIQNRDLEIQNLKHDLDVLKTDLDSYENKNKSTKLENLHSQNAKLIEKIDSLTQKCKGYESELLKLEQLKIENGILKTNDAEMKEEVLRLKEEVDQQQVKFDEEINAYREDTKKNLLSLESKIREKYEAERNECEHLLRNDFEEKLRQVAASTETSQEFRLNLLQKEDEIKELSRTVKEFEMRIKTLNDKHVELEKNHLDLIEENTMALSKLENSRKRLDELEIDVPKQRDSDNRLTEEIFRMQTEISSLQNENLKLSAEAMDLEVTCYRSLEEIAELKCRNNQLTNDFQQIIQENDNLVQDLAKKKLQYETISLEKEKWENIELEKSAQESRELEQLTTDNKKLQSELQQFEKEREDLKTQLCDAECQFTNLTHEHQLLQDEIQELKISPINTDDVEKIQKEHEKEINHLNDKLIQYKSLDLTNRTSIEFYENELQKMKNKNEKLNRKLDETLVTLNHCTDLTTSTETEYLRNVLYNYMLGKEGLVLARVIAAVCKFDDDQTEAILQREQQKQTLLGQLGFR
ncbi:hypothetical protein RI129_013231 [Pyrocoelia pectoralis]|uniref:GRIP domain-containing protein n=1 Tax=Pyrocoelia pectoralis TaxID=417401 RepID=A0AAN7V4J7_9COLE